MPCEDLDNACDEESVECDAETLVTCAENANGCLVETRTDCTTGANDLCDEGADPPVCKPDPCVTTSGLKPGACEEEGEFCEGHLRIVCERDSAGCPIADITDCTQDDDNNNCVEDGDEADCVEDPCLEFDDRCEEEGVRSCDGVELISCEEVGADDCLREVITDCASDPSETCDENGDDAECVDCDDECTSAGTTCASGVFRTCADTDADECLELTRETCGETCSPTLGCTFAVACDGPITATLEPDATSPEFDTEGGGNEFASFACGSSGNESGPDLLFAIDVPADTMAIVELDSEDFASGAPILLMLTDCSDDGPGIAEDSCTDSDATRVTWVNGGNATERAYVVVDSGASTNFGSFGLTFELDPIECGDGSRDFGEDCDDGNTKNDDGCDDDCGVETDYACTQVQGETSVCTLRPDDGRCGVLRCSLPANAEPGSVLCCTVDAECGLAFEDAYGNSCIALEQPGDNDNGCEDEPSTGGGWPTMQGCCRDEDDQCGLLAGPGVGCVLRSEVWTALQDGPGNLYTQGPFTDEVCD